VSTLPVPVKHARRFAGVAYGDSHKAGRGEGLRQHSLATAVTSMHVLPSSYVARLARDASVSLEAVGSALMLAGLMHDWGKSLAPYQEYLVEESTHAPIRHEVTSFIAIASLIKPREGAEACYLALAGAVLYHHHGLYDFVEKIVKYLRGGVRAWPNTRDGRYREDLRERLEATLNALRAYIKGTPAGEVLTLRTNAHEVVESLTMPAEPLRAVLKEAIDLEERVNRHRHVVVPLLTALMIGDNVSASIARAGDPEGVRILRMSEASAPVVVIRERDLVKALREAGLSRYADNLRRTYEVLTR